MIDEDEMVTGEFDAIELELDADGNPIVPLVTDDWIWAMQSAVETMQKSGKFRVESEDFFRPVPDIVKETVESAAGMQAARTIASLYDVTDGYELRWTYERGEERVPGGQIHLYGFAEVFGTWLHKLWGEHPEDADSATEDFTWEIRALDGANPDDDYQVVMHTPDVLPTYNLYWHAPRGETYRLRVDFMEYLDCLAETRGLHGWQYMMCDADLETDHVARERVRECTQLMRELFPDVDLSRYTTIDDDTVGGHGEEE